MGWMERVIFALALCSCAGSGAVGQAAPLRDERPADMRVLVGQCMADRRALEEFYSVPGSPVRGQRLRDLFREWLARLDALDFEGLGREDRIDWILLHHELEGELALLEREDRRTAEIAPLVPWAAEITALVEARQRVEPLDPAQAAGQLDRLRREVEQASKLLEESPPAVTGAVAERAAGRLDELREALDEWYGFRAGYDPFFTWWLRQPHETLSAALEQHGKLLREKLAGRKEDDQETIIGDPIGREALLVELERALIPYTPEELLAIGEREFAWCQAEMLAASRELGCGEDWKAALERVKQQHVAPGEQPALIKGLVQEAIDYVEANGLVSVPALVKETWRMDMLSPEAQRQSPFFLGGDGIHVSFPTDAMTHEEKRMSMRGNNRHFARATVHHEVVPGHTLQAFMNQRHGRHRAPFSTPFWTEGWALWWEILLWERGFFATPEDRIGALFWRMHRCARIRFSLGFHLGQLTPEQCIELLVEEVGHERENAEAEVRRSFEGGYGPLYQLAYMIGGLQFRALFRELVEGGRMSAREFHDAVLQGGNMPVELVRARLAEIPLTRDYQASWRFYPLGQ